MKQILQLSVLVALAMTSAAMDRWNAEKNGNKYFFEAEQRFNWVEALKECSRLNMSLVAIDTSTKQTDIYGILYEQHRAYGRGFWSGGHYSVIDRSFQWISTGQRFSYTQWSAGREPRGRPQHCVMFNGKTYVWNDARCAMKLGFICESNPTWKEKTSELDVLKKSVETQTYELVKTTEELDALKESSAVVNQKYELLETSMKTNEIQTKLTLSQNMEELEALKKSYESQTEQLKLKQQELDSLQKSSEQQLQQKQQELEASLKTQELQVNQTMQENLKEFYVLKKTYDIQTDQLKLKQQEMEVLQKSCEAQENQVNQKQAELETSLRTQELQVNQRLQENMQELDSLKESYEKQTDQLKLKQQELDSLQKSSEEQVKALQATLITQEIQANQTLNENLEELDVLNNSYDMQTDQFHLKQQEFDTLQKSSEEQKTQLKNKQEELDALKKSADIQTNGGASKKYFYFVLNGK